MENLDELMDHVDQNVLDESQVMDPEYRNKCLEFVAEKSKGDASKEALQKIKSMVKEAQVCMFKVVPFCYSTFATWLCILQLQPLCWAWLPQELAQTRRHRYCWLTPSEQEIWPANVATHRRLTLCITESSTTSSILVIS